MGGKVKLTEAQERILIDARDKGDVLATRQRVRACRVLVELGFLEKRKGRSRVLTESGRAHLASGRDD